MKPLHKILTTICLIALLPSCTMGESSASRIKHPNIVFILTDDMALGDLAYMPNTQKLIGDQGATFDQYFVSMSLCCPSRTSILRGQYAHNTEIFDNKLPGGGFEKAYVLKLEESMLPVWLAKGDYHTALIGKYLNAYPGSAGNTYIPPGWTEWYSPVLGKPWKQFNYTLNENGTLVEYGDSAEEYGTDVYNAKAVQFIQDSVAQNQPFFAFVSTTAPHEPSTPASRHAGIYASLKLPRSPSFNEEDITDKLGMPAGKRALLTEKKIQEMEIQYQLRLESLQAVDELVKNIVSELESLEKLEETYIIFSSDNGYHLGEHRLPAGKDYFYEEDIRVPLLIRGPGIPAGLHIQQLAGNIDLAPTFAELAGVRVPSFIDGRSLVPLLFNVPVDDWRQAFLLEKALKDGSQSKIEDDYSTSDPSASQFEASDLAQYQVTYVYFGLRTADYTYIEFDNDAIHIYDLNKDPYQLENFAPTADPTLLAEMHDWLKKLKNCKGWSCRRYEVHP